MSKLPMERYKAITTKLIPFSSRIGRELTIAELSRMLVSAFLIILILFLLFSDANPLTDNLIASDITATSQKYLDAVQGSAALAFLMARSLNAVISVIQTVNFEAGLIVSGSVSVGEFLDPINDLIERFSWVMLAVTVAISIQKLLMEIGLSLNLTWLVVSMLLLLLTRVLAQLYVSLPVTLDESTRARQSLHRFLVTVSSDAKARVFLNIPLTVIAAVLVIHLLIPSVGYLNAQISGSLIDEQRNEAIASIETSQEKITNASTPRKMAKNFDQVQRIVTAQTDNIITRSIELMAIFVIETIILPIAFFWVLLKLCAGTLLPRLWRRGAMAGRKS